MKNILSSLLFFFLLSVSQVFSQNTGAFTGADADIVNTELLGSKVYADYKGSPYQFEEYIPGRVVLKNKEVRAFDSLQLDLYKNQVLFLKSGNTKALENVHLDEVQLDTENGGRFKILEMDGSYNFYKILFSDKFNLLKYFEVALIVLDNQGASSYSGNTDINQRSFVTKEKYFLTKDFISMIEIPKSNKEFLSVFSEFKNLDSFIKKEKLKVKKELDLIEIFNELNRNY